MDESSPARAFKTPLKLTPEQEKRFLNHLFQRLDDCMKAMGRGADGRTEKDSWLDVRRINQLSFEGDYSWREIPLEMGGYLAGVFRDSNFSLGDGKRYVRHMAARVTDDLLGTAPFFAALERKGAGARDSLVKAVEERVQEAIEDSNVPAVLREACELALARNEAVIKLRSVFSATTYTGPAEVLVDERGEPIQTEQKGLYVYPNDDLIPVPPTEEETAAGWQAAVALEKDPSFRVPAAPGPDGEMVPEVELVYRKFDELEQVQVEADGLDARILDPRDFIFPVECQSVHEADIAAHVYDESGTRLAQTYRGFDSANAYFDKPESGANSAIASQGEQQGISDSTTHWVHVAEAYVRFDIDGDGREEHVLAIVDRDRQALIFCDHLANHMKKRPFEIIHGLRKVPNRAYGVGVFTDKYDQLIYIDKTFNRISLKNGKTASITVADRNSIEEWATNQGPITVGGNEILSRSKNWTEERGDPIQRFNLIEIAEEEVAMMNTMRQASDLEFGVSSPESVSALGLNPSDTAHGLQAVERSGNTIIKAVERVQTVGILAVLEQAVDIALENMDSSQLVVQGEGAKAELKTLNREEIRDLPRKVKLLLTRSRSTEGLASNQQAMQIVIAYLALAPPVQKVVRPFVLSQLKFLEIADADEKLPEVTDEDVAAWQAQQANAAQEPPKPLSKSVSTKYGELARSEQKQVLQQEGIEPASDEEIAGAAMRDAAAAAAQTGNRPHEEAA